MYVCMYFSDLCFVFLCTTGFKNKINEKRPFGALYLMLFVVTVLQATKPWPFFIFTEVSPFLFFSPISTV